MEDNLGALLLASILAAAFFLGGASRHDAASLLLLRPISVLLAGGALYFALGRGTLTHFVPFWLLVALAALVAVQLIPLPPPVWHSLPGRGLIVEADRLIGLENDVWRPLSLAPSRTYNALFSLAVPAASLLAFSLLDRRPPSPWGWRRVPLALLVLGLLAVVWAAMQLLGPNGGPLYTYSITNPDVPVGPFANRNHQAIFLASLVPLIGWQFLFAGRTAKSAFGGALTVAVAMIVVLTTVLLTGSRAGSALTLAAIGAVLLMLMVRNLDTRPRRAEASWETLSRRFAAPLIGAAIIAAIVFAWLYTGAELFDRIAGVPSFEDARAQTLPYVWELVVRYFPVGSGFGSFQFVYEVIEPSDLLSRKYLNQAHNDLLQIVLEGGLPGLVLLIGFLFWYLRSGLVLLRAGWKARFGPGASVDVSLGIAAFLSGAVVLVGSLFDYPLRTPLMMAYFALLCGLVARATKAKNAPEIRP